MAVYHAILIGTSGSYAGVFRTASITFNADSQVDAEEQAHTYADRISPLDQVKVDSVYELGAA
jgi:hypothetical protein